MASLTRAMCCMIYEIIVFENLPFQKLHSGDRFRKLAFLVPEKPLICGCKSPFSNFSKHPDAWGQNIFFLEITVLLTLLIRF